MSCWILIFDFCYSEHWNQGLLCSMYDMSLKNKSHLQMNQHPKTECSGRQKDGLPDVDLILVQVLALEQFWWSLCMPSLLHPPVVLSASHTCCTKTNCTYKNNRKMKHFQSPFPWVLTTSYMDNSLCNLISKQPLWLQKPMVDSFKLQMSLHICNCGTRVWEEKWCESYRQ